MICGNGSLSVYANCNDGVASKDGLLIAGGSLTVNADGDGFDINGSIVMTDGTVLVHGPTANMNGAVDSDRTFSISGGLLVAAGSSGMAQAPGMSSKQNSLLINFAKPFDANTLFLYAGYEICQLCNFDCCDQVEYSISGFPYILSPQER